ncbi:hypothetical protein AAZX31_08G299000 [Glycine max]
MKQRIEELEKVKVVEMREKGERVEEGVVACAVAGDGGREWSRCCGVLFLLSKTWHIEKKDLQDLWNIKLTNWNKLEVKFSFEVGLDVLPHIFNIPLPIWVYPIHFKPN